MPVPEEIPIPDDWPRTTEIRDGKLVEVIHNPKHMMHNSTNGSTIEGTPAVGVQRGRGVGDFEQTGKAD